MASSSKNQGTCPFAFRFCRTSGKDLPHRFAEAESAGNASATHVATGRVYYKRSSVSFSFFQSIFLK